MTTDPKPKRRWMPIVLILSLAVNLLIVGVAVGSVLRLKHSDHAKAPPGFGPALYRALPKEDRKALRGELSGLHGKGAKGRSQDFVAVTEALRAVPFDPETVTLLLQQQAQATAELQAALQEKWLVLVTQMSDEERQTYATRLEEVVKRGPRGHKKKH